MTEKTVAEAVQDVLQAIATFEDADVTINDWSVLDQPTTNAPYAIVETADDFGVTYISSEEVYRWSIPVTIIEQFQDWDTSLTAFRDTRQLVIDALGVGGGVVGLAVRAIRSSGPVGYIYPAYTQVEFTADAIPIFVTQRIIVDCEEF